ncbi:MAG: hypothetical protein IH886_15220 [Nitrospinae bacterium]|nr:hypothetical protein [Nitrospinota bacterium]
MALYIPHRCPKCFESVTLIQPLDKQDLPKGKARGHCVICGWREEVEIYFAGEAVTYYPDVPAQGKDKNNV